MLRRNLLWQRGLLPLALDADLVIAEFSLRAVSTWRLLEYRHRKGKPTILWGHSAGRRQASGVIRRWMIGHCDGFIAYMPREKERLQAEFPSLPIWVAKNSVMKAADCYPILKPADDVNDVIYVGRLVKEKKVRLLLRGFAQGILGGIIPEKTNLVFVGDGPERPLLQNEATAHGLASRVRFLGHITNTEQLRDLYAGSLMAVSPGYVGLSATQALGFGVPMVVADAERHSPEIELCVDGESGMFFRANDSADLARALGAVIGQKETWLARRATLSAAIRRDYTLEAMTATFSTAISEVLRKAQHDI